ncbi:MAG TPA: exopolysaccharide biosynthesis protein [Tepidisphaeraceae bacterium]|jgi:hypothetical protein|nr:exopolysaccharide biosynthesis protein [Tepidisphaeraceae bacterium]
MQPVAEPSSERILSLSEDLKGLLVESDGKGLTVGQILAALRERGHAVVLLILTLPFLFPIPTMGLSAPAGAAIALFGITLMIGRQPWMPNFFRKRHLSHEAVEKLVQKAVKWADRLQSLLKPRMQFMLWPGVNVVLGISLIILGFVMALPLPIPFTNAIPAFGIILLLLGIIERDGVFVLAGQLLTFLIVAACAVLGFFIYRHGWEPIKDWLGMGGSEATTQTAMHFLGLFS